MDKLAKKLGEAEKLEERKRGHEQAVETASKRGRIGSVAGAVYKRLPSILRSKGRSKSTIAQSLPPVNPETPEEKPSSNGVKVPSQARGTPMSSRLPPGTQILPKVKLTNLPLPTPKPLEKGAVVKTSHSLRELDLTEQKRQEALGVVVSMSGPFQIEPPKPVKMWRAKSSGSMSTTGLSSSNLMQGNVLTSLGNGAALALPQPKPSEPPRSSAEAVSKWITMDRKIEPQPPLMNPTNVTVKVISGGTTTSTKVNIPTPVTTVSDPIPSEAPPNSPSGTVPIVDTAYLAKATHNQLSPLFTAASRYCRPKLLDALHYDRFEQPLEYPYAGTPLEPDIFADVTEPFDISPGCRAPINTPKTGVKESAEHRVNHMITLKRAINKLPHYVYVRDRDEPPKNIGTSAAPLPAGKPTPKCGISREDILENLITATDTRTPSTEAPRGPHRGECSSKPEVPVVMERNIAVLSAKEPPFQDVSIPKVDEEMASQRSNYDMTKDAYIQAIFAKYGANFHVEPKPNFHVEPKPVERLILPKTHDGPSSAPYNFLRTESNATTKEEDSSGHRSSTKAPGAPESTKEGERKVLMLRVDRKQPINIPNTFGSKAAPTGRSKSTVLRVTYPVKTIQVSSEKHCPAGTPAPISLTKSPSGNDVQEHIVKSDDDSPPLSPNEPPWRSDPFRRKAALEHCFGRGKSEPPPDLRESESDIDEDAFVDVCSIDSPEKPTPQPVKPMPLEKSTLLPAEGSVEPKTPTATTVSTETSSPVPPSTPSVMSPPATTASVTSPPATTSSVTSPPATTSSLTPFAATTAVVPKEKQPVKPKPLVITRLPPPQGSAEPKTPIATISNLTTSQKFPLLSTSFLKSAPTKTSSAATTVATITIVKGTGAKVVPTKGGQRSYSLVFPEGAGTDPSPLKRQLHPGIPTRVVAMKRPVPEVSNTPIVAKTKPLAVVQKITPSALSSSNGPTGRTTIRYQPRPPLLLPPNKFKPLPPSPTTKGPSPAMIYASSRIRERTAPPGLGGANEEVAAKRARYDIDRDANTSKFLQKYADDDATDEIQKHRLNFVRSLEATKQQQSSPREDMIECALCGNPICLSRYSNLVNHVKRHCAVKQFKCLYCDYQHNECAKVRLHLLHMHHDRRTSPENRINEHLESAWKSMLKKCFPFHYQGALEAEFPSERSTKRPSRGPGYIWRKAETPGPPANFWSTFKTNTEIEIDPEVKMETIEVEHVCRTCGEKVQADKTYEPLVDHLHEKHHDVCLIFQCQQCGYSNAEEGIVQWHVSARHESDANVISHSFGRRLDVFVRLFFPSFALALKKAEFDHEEAIFLAQNDAAKIVWYAGNHSHMPESVKVPRIQKSKSFDGNDYLVRYHLNNFLDDGPPTPATPAIPVVFVDQEVKPETKKDKKMEKEAEKTARKEAMEEAKKIAKEMMKEKKRDRRTLVKSDAVVKETKTVKKPTKKEQRMDQLRPLLKQDQVLCELCEKVLKWTNNASLASLLAHAKRHLSRKQFQCNYCAYDSCESIHVRTHQLKKHNDALSEPLSSNSVQMQESWRRVMKECFPPLTARVDLMTFNRPKNNIRSAPPTPVHHYGTRGNTPKPAKEEEEDVEE